MAALAAPFASPCPERSRTTAKSRENFSPRGALRIRQNSFLIVSQIPDPDMFRALIYAFSRWLNSCFAARAAANPIEETRSRKTKTAKVEAQKYVNPGEFLFIGISFRWPD
jgi:hypothetical protein